MTAGQIFYGSEDLLAREREKSPEKNKERLAARGGSHDQARLLLGTSHDHRSVVLESTAQKLWCTDVAQARHQTLWAVDCAGWEAPVAPGWGPMSGAKQLQADIAAITAVLKRCARGIAVPS